MKRDKKSGSALLKDENLPEKDQTPPWLQYYNMADEITDEYWRNMKLSSGVG